VDSAPTEAVGGSSKRAIPDALAAWSNRGAEELQLPSGTRVRVHVADAQTLIRLGLIPADLLSIALAATRGISEPSEDDIAQYAALQRAQAVGCVRAIWDGSEWQPVTLTAALADELELPQEDLEVLEAVAMRRRTVAQINAANAQQPVEPEEAAGTVDGWTDFRGQRTSDDAGAGSADLRPVAGEDVPERDRPAAGRRNRRGAGREAAA
jgi:hypothetical protein